MADLNKTWKYQGHALKIETKMFEIDEAGTMRRGLRGTMDGEVKQFTMNIFRADWTTFLEIEHYLEIHASDNWGRGIEQNV